MPTAARTGATVWSTAKAGSLTGAGIPATAGWTAKAGTHTAGAVGSTAKGGTPTAAGKLATARWTA